MGDILHHQSALQNILQTQFGLTVTNHFEDSNSIQRQGRHATFGCLSKVSARDLQVL